LNEKGLEIGELRGKEGWEKMGDWDGYIYTMYKIDN